MFSSRELTAVITVLTETGDTNHSMRRLMRGRERERAAEWGVMDRWMDGGGEHKRRQGERKKGAVLGMDMLRGLLAYGRV